MDLSTIEGLTLTEEQRAAIIAQAKADTDAEVGGLKSKNDELLTEKKASEEAKALAERLANEAKAETELEKSRKAGDLSSLETQLTEKFNGEKAGLTSQLEALQNSTKASKQDAVLSELSQSFISPEASKLVLKQLVGVNLAEDGTTSTEYKGFDGNVVATDSKSFIEWAGKNESLAALMKPIESAGGGAGGNNGKAGGDTNTTNAKAQEAQKKGDLAGFLNASLKIGN